MKRMAGALLAVLWLCWAALGEGNWSAADWAAVTDALRSDAENPVPEERRLSVSPGQLSAAAGLDKAKMNILLLSTDAPDIRQNFGRSDVMMICSVDLETGDTRLLSLPAEARVSPEGLPEAVALKYANCFGGPLLAAKAVNEGLGLNIQRYCAVNFDAFTDVVDALGGVSLPLTETEAAALGLEAGERQLTGEETLRYVRLRQESQDMPRPRKLLLAVLDQALSRNSLDDAFALVEALLPILDTNLTTENLMDLLFALLGQEETPAFSARGLEMDGAAELSAGTEACHTFLYEAAE